MKKYILGWILGSAAAVLLAGCGGGTTTVGTGETQTETAAEGTASSAAPEADKLQLMEQKYAEGSFEAADYKTLAALYGESGQILKQRDMLELCYRLYQDEEAYSALQTITVNVAEESEAVREQAALLQQNINLEEYFNEGVSMLFSGEWFDTMMPRMTSGKRSYYLEGEGSTLYWETGYNDSRQKYTSIWQQTGEELLVLLQTGDTIQAVRTGVLDGSYNGAFDSWLCIGSEGDVYHETGTFDRGIYTGDYQAGVRIGKGEDQALSLWNMRADMDLTVYKGSFGGDGIAAVKQQDEQGVVYAYDESEKHYLFISTEESAENFVFGAETLGLPAYPVYEKYEPVPEDAGEAADTGLRVRIFDSNIEVFDGTRWVNMGSAAEYAAADPLAQPTGESDAGAAQEAEDGGDILSPYSSRGNGTIAPAATPKPTANPTPQSTPAPTATPAPTQAPATQPSAPQAPQAPAATPAPAPTPAPTQAPANGNDTDVEWTPDIL